MRASTLLSSLLSSVLLPVLLFSLGCSTPWDRHDEVLYTSMKEPSAETAAAYAKLLEEIIKNAEAAKRRPPAGVCAEYAYYQAKLGRLDQAKPYLEKEAQYYPEARTFLQALERFLQGVTPVASKSAKGDSSQ